MQKINSKSRKKDNSSIILWKFLTSLELVPHEKSNVSFLVKTTGSISGNANHYGKVAMRTFRPLYICNSNYECKQNCVNYATAHFNILNMYDCGLRFKRFFYSLYSKNRKNMRKMVLKFNGSSFEINRRVVKIYMYCPS